jgi:hypothetical protein
MTRRVRRRKPKNVWDFLDTLYEDNKAVHNLVTALALMATVAAFGITNRMHADALFSSVQGTEKQIDGRLNAIQAKPPQHTQEER